MVLRRLARAVLLCAVILGVWGGQMPLTTDCIVAYTLITPDGQEFDLSGFGDTGWRIGTGSSVQGHEGFGLPPVRHITQDVYQQPGALLQDVKVESRMVILTESVWATNRTRKDLHRARAALLDALRWDRGERAEASVLRYTVDDESFDLNVVYAGMAESPQGRDGVNEILSIRLMAHDPVWWDDEESDLVLDWSDNFTARYFIERTNQGWGATITQPVAVAGVTPEVRTIAIDSDTGDVYIGGDFLNWNNIPNADFLVRWNVALQAWQAVGDDGVGGPALNAQLERLLFGPDGTLYIAGGFTNGGGLGSPAGDGLVQVDVNTDTYSTVGGGPGVGVVTSVEDLAIGHDGTLFVTGAFTGWAGLGSPAGDYIVQLPLPYAAGAWATVGNGLNNIGHALVIANNGNLFAGGRFTQAGGNVVNRVAEWDRATWSDLDTGVSGTVNGLGISPDGTLFAAGNFATAGAAALAVNYVAEWNGVIWSDLDTGTNATVYSLGIDSEGNVYIGGIFIRVGSKPLTLADRVARWNGFSWAHLDVDLPGAGSVFAIMTDGTDLYLGFSTTGTAEIAGTTAVTNTGSALVYPIIEIKNEGLLQSIVNETLRLGLLFDYQILDGEIVTIDMSVGQKTITSNWRGNVVGELLPNSDLGTFKLEGAPRAAYGDVDGANLISVFITDADPRESGDNNNQLSDWTNITGISQDNTDLGKLYVNIVNVGGPPWRVDLYMDSGKAAADLVGHTANYAGAGAQVIIPDNDSGLGGSITIDALVAADTDIEVYFTIATIFWYDRWWSADEAVSE